MLGALTSKARFEGPPTVHQRNLVILLRELMLAHDFTGASQVLHVLLSRCEDIPDVIFRTGVEILRHHEVAYRPTIMFFQKMTLLDKKEREGIILELAFFHMRNGLFQEAYDQLSAYLLKEPYRKNPLFHGYCGILSYTLWKALALKLRQAGEELQSEALFIEAAVFKESTSEAIAVKTKFKVAKKHLAKAISLDPHSFIYVQYLVSLLMFREKYSQCRTIIQQFCHQNPSHPTGLRCYSILLRDHFPEEEETYRDCLVQLLALDPLSDLSFSEFLLLYKKEVLSAGDTAEMVARRLEFMPNNAWLWKKLWKLLKFPIMVDTPFWTQRLVWWPPHFFNTTNSFKGQEDMLVLWKSLASIYLMGKDNPFLLTAARYLGKRKIAHPSLPVVDTAKEDEDDEEEEEEEEEEEDEGSAMEEDEENNSGEED